MSPVALDGGSTSKLFLRRSLIESLRAARKAGSLRRDHQLREATSDLSVYHERTAKWQAGASWLD